MAVVIPQVGSRQGINALKNGIQIGGTTFTTGAGAPSGVMTALKIGDVYIDQTNGAIYVATATGTGSWSTFAALASAAATFDVGTNLTVGGTAAVTGVLTCTAAPILPTATVVGGTTVYTFNGIANSGTPNRKGDLGVDYAAGKLYVAGGVSASTDWKLVTSA